MVELLTSATQETKDNLGDQGTEAQILLRKQENILLDEGPNKIIKAGLGDAYTIGHPTNGVLGTANGIGGTQITIGYGKIGTISVEEVSNINNRFRLYLRSIETDDIDISDVKTLDMVDSSNTTATVDTNNYKIDFTAGEVFQTNVIAYKSGVTIQNVRVVLPDNDFTFTTGGSGSTFPMTFPFTLGGGDFLEVSSDNGSNWQKILTDTNTTIADQGEKLLIRITGDSGTYIKIRDTNSGDTPIEVYYNENI